MTEDEIVDLTEVNIGARGRAKTVASWHGDAPAPRKRRRGFKPFAYDPSSVSSAAENLASLGGTHSNLSTAEVEDTIELAKDIGATGTGGHTGEYSVYPLGTKRTSLQAFPPEEYDVAYVDEDKVYRPMPNPLGYHGKEMKHHMLYNVNWFDNTCTSAVVNLIPCNATSTGRIGRQINLKSIYIKGVVYPDDYLHGPLRGDLYVFWDNQPGAAVPSATDLFEDMSVYGNFYSLAPVREDNRQRFTVLVHRVFQCQSEQVIPVDKIYEYNKVFTAFDLYKDLSGYRTTYKGDGSTLADIATGALYVCTTGDYTTPESFLELAYTCTLHYTE